MLQGTHGVIRRLRTETTTEQFFEGRIALGPANHCGHFGAEFVRRSFMAATERKHDHPQQAAQHVVREIGQQLIQCPFRLTKAFFHGPGQQGRHVPG
ncbi:hypothetical protein D9M69_724500 [compost metagenome]